MRQLVPVQQVIRCAANNPAGESRQFSELDFESWGTGVRAVFGRVAPVGDRRWTGFGKGDLRENCFELSIRCRSGVGLTAHGDLELDIVGLELDWGWTGVGRLISLFRSRFRFHRGQFVQELPAAVMIQVNRLPGCSSGVFRGVHNFEPGCFHGQPVILRCSCHSLVSCWCPPVLVLVCHVGCLSPVRPMLPACLRVCVREGAACTGDSTCIRRAPVPQSLVFTCSGCCESI